MMVPDGDPRALRVGVAPAHRLDGDPSASIAPPPADGAAGGTAPWPDGTDAPGAVARLDGSPVRARLIAVDAARARLEVSRGGSVDRTPVLFGPARLDRARGTTVREVVVDGWRVEVEVEPERRALLRERARRGAGAIGAGGPVEVRAIIPGRVVAVAVEPGDAVEAGQQVLVVEAMKMQNELRAPREGTVERVGVAVGATIEVGDLLVVIR
ncbi:MAG: biotin/lipoyl-binding protein [Chloroflexi bacterium]|nr:biotin/lipoyl-binding protein [Chloroflexota bacterium]